MLATKMVIATLLAHTGELLTLTLHGGWALNLQAFYMFAAVAIALLGAGEFPANCGGKFDQARVVFIAQTIRQVILFPLLRPEK